MKNKFVVPVCVLIWIPAVSLAENPTYQLYNLVVPGPPGVNPAAIVAADFNGDHKIDFAAATQSGSQPNQVLIYLNNGDGTFQQPKSFAVGQFVDAMTNSPRIRVVFVLAAAVRLVGSHMCQARPEHRKSTFAALTARFRAPEGNGRFPSAAARSQIGAPTAKSSSTFPATN